MTAADHLDTLANASLALSRARSLEEGLRACVDVVGPAVQAMSGGIVLWDEKVGALQVAATFGPMVDLAAINAGYLQGRGDLMAIQVFTSGEALYIPNLLEYDTPFGAAVARSGVRSMVVEPLRTGDTILGVIAFAFPYIQDFSVARRRFLPVLASHVAHWIEAARRTLAIEAERDHLRRAERLKDEFLSTLSHELRTPINAITGYGGLLADGIAGSLSTVQAEYVKRLLEATDKLLRLVDDLLDMTHIRAGKLSLRKVEADLGEVVQDVLASLGPQAESSGIRLIADIGIPAPRCAVDPMRMHQVLTNLVGNAIKFMGSPGTVAVAVREEADEVICEVRDQGPGFPPETVPWLFERFTQLDMSDTRPRGGLGLGLAIAKSLIEAHGGSIGATSGGEEGATFWFRIPRSVDPELEALSPPAAP